MASNSTAQNFVPIRDIKDGVVLLKNGQMCMVLLASSINFALKSSDEQTAILHQFQAFLNTIDFSLQIYLQSRRLDINPYLAQLAQLEPKQDNDLMRIQLREYMDFVKTFTTEVDIMSKSFFVVVPYSPVSANIKSSFSSILGGGKDATHSDERFQEHRVQLEQRVTVVEQGLNRIGVRTAVLQNDELVELYYHLFNPDDVAADVSK
ncbi:MAG: type IV secretory pathway VirB4 component [Candidatus Azotimanducaceae bacterium]|jgi:type IV secretory pathway VirB4 component